MWRLNRNILLAFRCQLKCRGIFRKRLHLRFTRTEMEMRTLGQTTFLASEMELLSWSAVIILVEP
ncbi:hypothetical protein BX600DRAFT_464433 [Xylariales sp. PMI_506]|nr:hypothetical protein BX600DRAFT_464433 [Xylariales sp. PMI_506]